MMEAEYNYIKSFRKSSSVEMHFRNTVYHVCMPIFYLLAYLLICGLSADISAAQAVHCQIGLPIKNELARI
jgi:hypothetical protein